MSQRNWSIISRVGTVDTKIRDFVQVNGTAYANTTPSYPFSAALSTNSPYSGIPPGKFSASLGIHRYWRKHLPLDKISNHASNLVHPEAMSLAIGINIRQGVSIRLGPEVKPSLISNILEECSPLFRIVIKCTRVRWAKVIASFAEKP